MRAVNHYFNPTYLYIIQADRAHKVLQCLDLWWKPRLAVVHARIHNFPAQRRHKSTSDHQMPLYLLKLLLAEGVATLDQRLLTHLSYNFYIAAPKGNFSQYKFYLLHKINQADLNKS